MEPPNPSLRDQGLEALKEGNIEKAADLLVRAVMADDNDVEAKALLGVAYSQKGLHAQAKRALQTACEREPRNINYRFNLGVVLERAGDGPGAAIAFRDTLQLNPAHTQARAKLQAMGPQAQQWIAQAPKPVDAVGVPGAPQGGQPPQGYAPPSAPPAGPMAAPPPPPSPGYGTPPPGYGPPPGQGGSPQYAAPSGPAPTLGQMGYQAQAPGMGGMGGAGSAPSGTVECPTCHQFSRFGMICEFCNGVLPPPPRQAPPGSAPVTMGAPVGGPPPFSGMAGYAAQRMDDSFNLGDAFRAWIGVIAAPRAFFQEQANYSGFQGPMAFILSTLIVSAAVQLIQGLVLGQFSGPQGGFRGFGLLVGIPCGFVFALIGAHIWGAIVHMASKMFGGQAEYSGSFRAATYSQVPMNVAALLFGLLMPFVLKSMLPAGATPGATPRSISSAPAPAPMTAAASFAAPRPMSALAQVTPPGFPGSPGVSSGAPSSQQAMDILTTLLQRIGPLLLLFVVGWIWSIVVLVIAISEVHSLGTGAAVGVVVVAWVISIAIVVLLWVVLAAAIMGAIMGAAGGAGR
jgi:hypothetical protein